MDVAVKNRFKELKCCVIVPTYNNGGTLKPVLDQLLTYTDDLLVTNDGATDNTPSILASYKDKISIITHEQNQGSGNAIAQCLSLALVLLVRNYADLILIGC